MMTDVCYILLLSSVISILAFMLISGLVWAQACQASTAPLQQCWAVHWIFCYLLSVVCLKLTLWMIWIWWEMTRCLACVTLSFYYLRHAWGMWLKWEQKRQNAACCGCGPMPQFPFFQSLGFLTMKSNISVYMLETLSLVTLFCITAVLHICRLEADK
jgi:hypothetical protein